MFHGLRSLACDVPADGGGRQVHDLVTSGVVAGWGCRAQGNTTSERRSLAEEVLKARRDARRRHYVATRRRTAVRRPVAPSCLDFAYLQLAKTSYPVWSSAAVKDPTSRTRTPSTAPPDVAHSMASKIERVFRSRAVMLDREDAVARNLINTPSCMRGCGVALVWSHAPVAPARLPLSNQATFAKKAQTRPCRPNFISSNPLSNILPYCINANDDCSRPSPGDLSAWPCCTY